MSKRGSVELAVMLAVILVALIGVVIVMKTPLAKPVLIKVQPQPSVQSPAPVKKVSSSPTGRFGTPTPQEYGGAIKGIAAPGTRAFAGGRAYEMGVQTCYTCSCLDEGITADAKSAATRVCTDNCGGTISQEKAGPCR